MYVHVHMHTNVHVYVLHSRIQNIPESRRLLLGGDNRKRDTKSINIFSIQNMVATHVADAHVVTAHMITSDVL